MEDFDEDDAEDDTECDYCGEMGRVDEYDCMNCGDAIYLCENCATDDSSCSVCEESYELEDAETV